MYAQGIWSFTLPPRVNKSEVHTSLGELRLDALLEMSQPSRNEDGLVSQDQLQSEEVHTQHKQPDISHKVKNGPPFHCTKKFESKQVWSKTNKEIVDTLSPILIFKNMKV